MTEISLPNFILPNPSETRQPSVNHIFARGSFFKPGQQIMQHWSGRQLMVCKESSTEEKQQKIFPICCMWQGTGNSPGVWSLQQAAVAGMTWQGCCGRGGTAEQHCSTGKSLAQEYLGTGQTTLGRNQLPDKSWFGAEDSAGAVAAGELGSF